MIDHKSSKARKQLRVARSRGLSITKGIEPLHFNLLLIANSDDREKPEAIEQWIEKLEHFISKFRAAAADGERIRVENEFLRDGTVQRALRYMKDRDNDVFARAILYAGKNVRLLYDGDAAQKLLRTFAATCEEPFKAALTWLAKQSCSRHAFALSNKKRQFENVNGDKDYSVLPEPKNMPSRRKYDAYLGERWRLLAKDYKKRSGKKLPRDYMITEAGQEHSEKLYRQEQKLKGKSPGSIRISALRWRRLAQQTKR